MKIVLIIIAVLLLVGVGFGAYKMYQLNRIQYMTTEEIIQSSTKGKGFYISVAIIENGEITYHTYGENGVEIPNRDFDYEIGSLTKTMTSLMVSKAIEEGKMDLSSPISDYLNVPNDKYYPTLDRVLTHTSGYKGFYLTSEMIGNELHHRNSFYGVDKASLLASAASVKLSDKDYAFNYSNFGISVAGLALEQVYQKTYTELLQLEIIEPLQLDHTFVASCQGNLNGYWDWKENDAYIPAGAVISNITDMATYLNYYMTSDESYVLKPLEPIKKVNANNSIYDSMGIRIDEVGMSWLRDTERGLIWHNGSTSNFNSYIGMTEDRSKGVVVLANYGGYDRIPAMVLGVRFLTE